MSWFTSWLDYIAVRLCRYYLQRDLGQYLEKELTVDHLHIDAYNGKGSATDLALNNQVFNDAMDSMAVPVKVTDVFVKEIKVGIPHWSSLWTAEFSDIEVHGVSFNIKNKNRSKPETSILRCWSNLLQLAGLSINFILSENFKKFSQHCRSAIRFILSGELKEMCSQNCRLGINYILPDEFKEKCSQNCRLAINCIVSNEFMEKGSQSCRLVVNFIRSEELKEKCRLAIKLIVSEEFKEVCLHIFGLFVCLLFYFYILYLKWLEIDRVRTIPSTQGQADPS